MDTKVIQVRDLMAKSEVVGYNRALNDVLSELRLKKADGFILSDNLLTEIFEVLIEKNNNGRSKM